MGARVRVLVAEDNDDYRTVLRILLTSLGCSVVEASNGLEAVEQAKSTHPDLIIMDCMMPQLGGLEATKRLKENPSTRDIPVVICSALGMEALGHTKLLDCAHEFIEKPIRLEKLRDIVRKYVLLENQQQTSFTAEKKESIDIVAAWRLVEKVKNTITEDSLQAGFPEAHNLEKLSKARRPGQKNRETLWRLLLSTNGAKLFAGLVQLLHGGIGCLELLPVA
jgi:CheY-like chemotaxis protein